MHLIIARALASRARNARLFPGKFLVALPFISKIWLGVAGMLIAFRMLAASGPLSLWHCAQLILALALPVFVLQAVLDRYPAHSLSNQPSLRLARLGRWRQIPALECSAFEKYGSGGLLTMLIAGLLLNIPVRVFEFMAAMPAPKLHTPSWYLSLHDIMLARSRRPVGDRRPDGPCAEPADEGGAWSGSASDRKYAESGHKHGDMGALSHNVAQGEFDLSASYPGDGAAAQCASLKYRAPVQTEKIKYPLHPIVN